MLERLPREYAYTTILTVLARLHAKGVIEREKVEGAWHYHPARSRVATLAQALDRLEAMIRARRRPS